MELRELLEQVQAGRMTIEKAETYLKDMPYEELGFAKLDHHRSLRSGFGEVIYCAGKSIDHLVSICQHFAAGKEMCWEPGLPGNSTRRCGRRCRILNTMSCPAYWCCSEKSRNPSLRGRVHRRYFRHSRGGGSRPHR